MDKEPTAVWPLGSCTGSTGVAPVWAAGWQGRWEQRTEPCTLHNWCLQGLLPWKGLEPCSNLPAHCSSPAMVAGPQGTPWPHCPAAAFPILLPGHKWERQWQQWEENLHPTAWNFPENNLVILPFYSPHPHLPSDCPKLPQFHKSPLTAPPIFWCDILASLSSPRWPTSTGTFFTVAAGGLKLWTQTRIQKTQSEQTLLGFLFW